MDGETDFFEASGLGMQTSDVRLANSRAVLTLIAVNAGLSAAELARRTRLAPQTVAAILDDLGKAGLLLQGEVLRGRRGQPATPYTLNPAGAYTIGFEIGWRHIEAVMINIGGHTISQYRRDYAFPDAATIFTELAAVTRQFVEQLPEAERSKIVGVGIAAPSGIGRNISLLNADPELARAWHGIDLVAAAEKATGFPVQLYNDGNAACWADLIYFPPPRPSSFAYILVSTFIAAGIVAENMLWQGPTGNSANLGSMLVTDRHGEQNFGHLLASIFALEQRLVATGKRVPDTTPMFWPWQDWEPQVSDWIDDASRALAKTILNTAAVIEYRTAVVDCTAPPAIRDRLLEATRARMAELPTLTFDTPQVVAGHLGGRAPSVGAAFLPIYRRFFSRDLSHMPD